MVTDARGRVLYINEDLRGMLGYSIKVGEQYVRVCLLHGA